jgi:hypothetical protein
MACAFILARRRDRGCPRGGFTPRELCCRRPRYVVFLLGPPALPSGAGPLCPLTCAVVRRGGERSVRGDSGARGAGASAGSGRSSEASSHQRHEVLTCRHLLRTKRSWVPPRRVHAASPVLPATAVRRVPSWTAGASLGSWTALPADCAVVRRGGERIELGDSGVRGAGCARWFRTQFEGCRLCSIEARRFLMVVS